MTDVVIAGIGQTEVGEHWSIGLRDLAFAAIQDAVRRFRWAQTAIVICRQHACTEFFQPGASRCTAGGLRWPDWHRSRDHRSRGRIGGAALRQGYLAIASGMVDVALVVGVEKFTDKVGPEVDAALATTSDSDFEHANRAVAAEGAPGPVIGRGNQNCIEQSAFAVGGQSSLVEQEDRAGESLLLHQRANVIPANPEVLFAYVDNCCSPRFHMLSCFVSITSTLSSKGNAHDAGSCHQQSETFSWLLTAAVALGSNDHSAPRTPLASLTVAIQ